MNVDSPLFDWTGSSTGSGAVNTTQAANGSGSLFNSFISGLSGLATGTAAAYNAFNPKPTGGVAAVPGRTTATSGIMAYLPWLIGGALVIFGFVFFFTRKK